MIIKPKIEAEHYKNKGVYKRDLIELAINILIPLILCATAGGIVYGLWKLLL